MKRISEITKRDIFDLLKNDALLETYGNKYDNLYYWGRLDEIEFLNRLYNLKNISSSDDRFDNAEADIFQHTINNDDFEYGWVFKDERFQLKNGDDEYFLNFICEIFHPEVRNDRCDWKKYYYNINKLLQYDGYELYEKDYISKRAVYGWRIKNNADTFIKSQSESIKINFNTEYVNIQIELMNNLIEIAPHSAIGKAKELLEMCCKTILDEQLITYEIHVDFAQLMKMTCDSIGLNPNNVSDKYPERDNAKKILGNLRSISHGLAELRNLHGDGHGKNKNFTPLPPRYARLAVGASVIAVNFIWETYLEYKK